jgi:hypothetical protein
MRLADFTTLAEHCRENGFGLAEFRRQGAVIDLRWPTDVVEQWLYDHCDKSPFLHDYGTVDLSRIGWKVEALPVETLMTIPTGPSEADVIEELAADPDHLIAVRDQGEHLGVREAWETHGTWKRWPIILDRSLLAPPADGLQLVEGRTRVGILRGRQRQGKLVADRHLAWVGRPRI